jgi:alpha-L-rhamnosidase
MNNRPVSAPGAGPRHLLIVVALLLISLLTRARAESSPVGLRCEYRTNPRGLDERRPRLSWRLESAERGARQTAFRILVASTPSLLLENKGDLWDTGNVAGDSSVNVPYTGRRLQSRQQCFWKVQVWDRQGRARWSEPAAWTMGLLEPSDWLADYISYRDTSPVWTNAETLFLPPAAQYRKDFAANKGIKRATIYASALGIYELFLNGERVGDARFAPGWTDYHQRAYYWTYDVTRTIARGANTIAAWVGDGWYSGYIGFGLLTAKGTEHIGRYTYGKTPALMLQLEVEYADGTIQRVVTDKSWKVTQDGPIREGDFLMGEYYDARREQKGWHTPGFDDSNWNPAILASENGSIPAMFYEEKNPQKAGDAVMLQGHPVDLGFRAPGKLEAFPGVPVRPIEELKPISVTSLTNGTYIFNMGQNFAGLVRLKVKGPAGTTVQLRYGEMLYPNGTLMNENYRKARSIDHYVLRGDPNGEEWTPRFTFHGFQYVEATGLPAPPTSDTLRGIVLHSDTPLTSEFECSDPMANRLFKNIVWTQRANFVDLPTDCPQRDERFGWMGDAQIYARCATLNADAAAFYTKWLREVVEAQRDSGAFADFAPFPYQHGWDFAPAWTDAGVICPWTIWQAYGDTRLLERCWPAMTRFMEWRKARSPSFLGVRSGNEWGDWLCFGPKTPIELIDHAYFAYSARLMSEMAAAIGKQDEASAYRKLFENIRAAFNAQYLRPDGSLSVDTQTAYALALFARLIPSELRVRTGNILADKLRNAETTDNSGMTTGFVGTYPLLPVLTSVGQNDLAVKHFQSRKFPSWGYEIEQGATTIWEHWDSYTKAHGFSGEDGQQNASMNSFAHYSFGAVGQWMLEQLAGICAGDPGYQRILIRPHPPSPHSNSENRPIDWVKAHYDSIRGRIESEWRRSKAGFDLRVVIPANTTAIIYLPAGESDSIKESGQPVSRAQGARFLGIEEGRAVIEVGSGEYQFTSELLGN